MTMPIFKRANAARLQHPDARGTPRGSAGALAALAEAIGAPSATMQPADGHPPVPNGGTIT
jgi:hypothetical protein